MLFSTLLLQTAFVQTVDPTIGINDHLDVGNILSPMQIRPVIVNSNGDFVTLPTVGSALVAYYNGSIPFGSATAVPVADLYPTNMTQWADNFGTVVIADADIQAELPGSTFETPIGAILHESGTNPAMFHCAASEGCPSGHCGFEVYMGLNGVQFQCIADTSCSDDGLQYAADDFILWAAPPWEDDIPIQTEDWNATEGEYEPGGCPGGWQ